MSTRTVAVLTAGLNQPSATRLLADQLAAAVTQELDAAGVPSRTHLVEVRDHAHDVVNHLLTGFPSPQLERELNAVATADALVAVTPVFGASYSGLFKSFVDVLGRDALVDVPVLVGATGGTARHSLVLEHALRPLFAHLRAVVVPTAVFAAPEDWGGGDGALGALAGRASRAAAELAREVRRREPRSPVDPFSVTTPFEEMLRGHQADPAW